MNKNLATLLFLGANIVPATHTNAFRFKVTQEITPFIWAKLRILDVVDPAGNMAPKPKALAYIDFDF
jgi:hypothetical protein